jgi:hypothetical protein
MIVQLNPPLSLVTPKGKGFAYFLIDYGIDYDLLWVVFQNDTNECWTWLNKDIRITENITYHRGVPSLSSNT